MTYNSRRSTVSIEVPGDRDRDKGPVSIDETRIFYRESSPTPGGMRMNWVDYIPYREGRTVEVVYNSGYTVQLSGRDAFTFLRIVRDKDAYLFEERRPN